MSLIKPGDVMLTKSCRMVRVMASRDDGAVAMRDYRSRVAVRSVDTDRLSYHSEHELTLVQPPATPQEPNRPDLDTVTELWRRQMYPAIDRALFVECFNDRANPGWQVVRDEVSAVRAVLLHFALPSPPTPEGGAK